MFVCEIVYVCVCERERERERVCVCERERVRDSKRAQLPGVNYDSMCMHRQYICMARIYIYLET